MKEEFIKIDEDRYLLKDSQSKIFSKAEMQKRLKGKKDGKKKSNSKSKTKPVM